MSENYLLWKAVPQSLKNIFALHLKNCGCDQAKLYELETKY